MSSNELVDQTGIPPPPKKRMVKRRPARKQVEPGQIIRKAPEQTGQTFNVWYGKWAGGDQYDQHHVSEKAQTRLGVVKDAGYTRADSSGQTYCCLFFARGCCPAGPECTFLHRLPPPSHMLPDTSRDVFNREKHADYRDDMGGIGSFQRQNRTLYIGRIKETRNTAEMVERHFEEFGEIERIRILQSRGVAFVTYFNELNAQFAKEAMTDQSLDSDEILNVRWANEDPNPTAIRAEKAHLKQLGEAGIGKALDPDFIEAVRVMDELENGSTEQTRREFDEGDVRATKRTRIEGKPEEQPVEQVVVVEQKELESKGILSKNTLESLKFLSSMNKLPVAVSVAAAASTIGGLGGLADYGSDDE